MTRRRRSHYFTGKAALALFAALNLAAPVRSAVVIDPYAWQFPQAAGVSGADDLIQRLQEEIQLVLNAGHLAPAFNYYADQNNEEYWLFNEPGRIITTLAWAYPYLTAAQQQAVKTYVQAEFADVRYMPWNGNGWQPYHLPGTLGALRERHPTDVAGRPTGAAWAGNRPTVQVIYGFWLYAYRTNDWTTVQNKWSNIKSFYTTYAAAANIYGTMSAHIAMARLADKFGDSAMRTTALNNLQTQLNAGADFPTIVTRCYADPAKQNYNQYYADMWDSRKDGLVYRGFMFLNLSPEMGRYLKDNVLSAALAYHNQGKSDYPYWWMMETEHFCRHTGDEGIGMPSEVMGMMMPVERWVAGTQTATLRNYVRSWTNNIGDCHWLEALVTVIEAHGSTQWVDVRNQTVNTNPPAAPRNFRLR